MMGRMKSQEYYDEVAVRRRAVREALIARKPPPSVKKKKPLHLYGTKTGRISTLKPGVPRVKGENDMTTYPTRAGMTLRRFNYAMRFICVRCSLSKTSKFRAETPEGVICNGCYGKKLTEVSK